MSDTGAGHARAALALVAAMVAFEALFLLTPGLDLAVSGWFYDPTEGFRLADVPWLERVRLVLRMTVFLVGLLALALLVVALLRRDRSRTGWRPWAFAVLGLVLGPGLIVNAFFKEYWGRARPDDITQFGGPEAYSPPFVFADGCAENCSFPSGEAAGSATAVLIVLALFWPRASPAARAALGTIGAAVMVLAGGLRIATGRHFLSDVIFAWLICALFLVVLHGLLGLGRHPGLTVADIRADVGGS